MPVHAPSDPHVRRAEPNSSAEPEHRAEQTVPTAAEAEAEQLVTVEGAESGGQRICSAGQAVRNSRAWPARDSPDQGLLWQVRTVLWYDMPRSKVHDRLNLHNSNTIACSR